MVFLQMLKLMFGTGYLVQEETFQFDTPIGEEPSIVMDYPKFSSRNWILTREGTVKQVYTYITLAAFLT